MENLVNSPEQTPNQNKQFNIFLYPIFVIIILFLFFIESLIFPKDILIKPNFNLISGTLFVIISGILTKYLDSHFFTKLSFKIKTLIEAISYFLGTGVLIYVFILIYKLLKSGADLWTFFLIPVEFLIILGFIVCIYRFIKTLIKYREISS